MSEHDGHTISTGGTPEVDWEATAATERKIRRGTQTLADTYRSQLKGADAEIKGLREALDATFRALAAVLLTTGNVRVAESTIVGLRRPAIYRVEQGCHVVYGATNDAVVGEEADDE